MCGILGIVQLRGGTIEAHRFDAMVDSMSRRGPDGRGVVFFNSKKQKVSDSAQNDDFDVGLGHRRLAIIDLSFEGLQPMSNEDGSVWLIFNGMIYNYESLRDELKGRGHTFKSGTDTEVLLHGYEEWGADLLSKLNGMFSFCIYDMRKNELFCARDRMGIKPFYYYYDNDKFICASEIKTILKDSSVPRTIDHNIAYLYLQHRVLDLDEHTFFSHIKRLKGGYFLRISLNTKQLEIKKWWSVPPLNTSFDVVDMSEKSKEFFERFKESVGIRLKSDVPVGVCLSGGLDSTAIFTAINSIRKDASTTSISALYPGSETDEKDAIEKYISLLRTKNLYVYPPLNKETFFSLLTELIVSQEEPVMGLVSISQLQVFERAKQEGLKVMLNGQGADELLTGYDYHHEVYYKTLARRWHPIKLTRELNKSFYVRAASKERKRKFLHGLLLQFFGTGDFLGDLFAYKLPDDSYLSADFKSKHRTTARDYNAYQWRNAELGAVMDTEFTRLRLPYLLRFEDKNSMAHSVESRLPFLDYTLVEFSFALPFCFKFRNGQTKAILRSAFKGVMPEHIRTNQKKQGWSGVDAVWFRDFLKEMIEDIVHSPDFNEIGYFDVSRVQAMYKNFFEGKESFNPVLWRIINFYLWKKMIVEEVKVFP